MRVWQQDYTVYDEASRRFGAWEEVSTTSVPLTINPQAGPIGSDGSLLHPNHAELARMAWAVAQVDWHTGAPVKVMAGTFPDTLPRPSSTLAEHVGATMCAQTLQGMATCAVDNAGVVQWGKATKAKRGGPDNFFAGFWRAIASDEAQ